MKKQLLAFLSLFTSGGTLICCAIPALLVTLGMGATLAGLVAQFPQLIWLSENKNAIFGIGAILLTTSAALQWQNRNKVCAVGELKESCEKTRDWSRPLFFVSLGIYLVGATITFILPNLPF